MGKKIEKKVAKIEAKIMDALLTVSKKKSTQAEFLDDIEQFVTLLNRSVLDFVAERRATIAEEALQKKIEKVNKPQPKKKAATRKAKAKAAPAKPEAAAAAE